MNRYLICNDVHLGVTRVAGTTPLSALALKSYLQQSFQDLIMSSLDKDLIILGDLFDSFTVEGKEILGAYLAISTWLLASGRTVHLVPGNHDWSAKGDKLSSFHFLGEVLSSQFGERVMVYGPEFTEIEERLYVIPHCANQDLFDIELAKALDAPGGILMLHCNVMNPFTDKSDHSLNINEEWCDRLTAKHRLVIAHEHQKRFIDKGRGIFVLGNQFPSSVSDCLDKAQQHGFKSAHILESDMGISEVNTWFSESDEFGYAQVEWQDLANITDQKFIRVAGRATAEQASEVITAIAKFRSKSEAFVVTNAVAIEGMNDMQEMTEVSLDEIQSFNVLGALFELLEPAERKVIKEVLNDQVN